MQKYSRPLQHADDPLRLFSPSLRWPLVTSAELGRLQEALTRYLELSDSDAAQELLTLVASEIRCRNLPDFGPGPGAKITFPKISE